MRRPGGSIIFPDSNRTLWMRMGASLRQLPGEQAGRRLRPLRFLRVAPTADPEH
jgi:hypothetical protein